MFFNKAADEDYKMEIAGALEVQHVANPGQYLDIPTIWGRSRREALNYLKDRISSKITSWRNKMLNNAGKDVLIKSVVTTLPTYVMSVFKLPISWCDEINSMVAKFWWGRAMATERYTGSVGRQ